MRLAELSRAAGLSPTTVKWYIRIGLLPRGEPTAANQAQYGADHLHRLRLIRALVDVGGLSTDAVHDVLAAIDDPQRPINEVFAVARRAGASPGADIAREAIDRADSFINHRGWDVPPASPTRRELAAILNAMAVLQPPPDSVVPAPQVGDDASVFALLDPYADAVEPLARAEIINTSTDLPRDLLTERVVAGTVLMERALAALRRLAQEHYSARHFTS
ncbi:MerR-like DNA binding protein [Mycobacterium sp. BK086]|uniref:MerR family transcriptional regulator n=1 Tax=Mycobacterium sp. BK086 TaxID=2512165 RepID=UPI0010609109|nr:MerR family transcriptional regulator [Mycobacterium sp. BK086]TDO17747.1 MerR-like DNA binding protein [Mycobacterium sp. BK086]